MRLGARVVNQAGNISQANRATVTVRVEQLVWLLLALGGHRGIVAGGSPGRSRRAG